MSKLESGVNSELAVQDPNVSKVDLILIFAIFHRIDAKCYMSYRKCNAEHANKQVVGPTVQPLRVFFLAKKDKNPDFSSTSMIFAHHSSDSVKPGILSKTNKILPYTSYIFASNATNQTLVSQISDFWRIFKVLAQTGKFGLKL